MDKEQTKAAIAVMQAWVDGKPVEARTVNSTNYGQWSPVLQTQQPVWAWAGVEYRIKPETVKSRRFIWRSANGTLHTSLVTPEGLGKKTIDEFVKAIDAIMCQTFVRWIDADWVEVEA